MNFYTVILRESAGYWVALCLENGTVAQGETKKRVLEKLKEAVSSFDLVRQDEPDIYTAPVSIKELHEFLTIEEAKVVSEPLELSALYT